jgi:hypothetical protein
MKSMFNLGSKIGGVILRPPFDKCGVIPCRIHKRFPQTPSKTPKTAQAGVGPGMGLDWLGERGYMEDTLRNEKFRRYPNK